MIKGNSTLSGSPGMEGGAKLLPRAKGQAFYCQWLERAVAREGTVPSLPAKPLLQVQSPHARLCPRLPRQGHHPVSTRLRFCPPPFRPLLHKAFLKTSASPSLSSPAAALRESS